MRVHPPKNSFSASLCMLVQSLLSCPTLCDPIDCSLPGSSVYRILQARILEWVAMPSFRGPSQPRDRFHVSCASFLHWQASSLPLVPPGMFPCSNNNQIFQPLLTPPCIRGNGPTLTFHLVLPVLGWGLRTWPRGGLQDVRLRTLLWVSGKEVSSLFSESHLQGSCLKNTCKPRGHWQLLCGCPKKGNTAGFKEEKWKNLSGNL